MDEAGPESPPTLKYLNLLIMLFIYLQPLKHKYS